MKWEYKVEKIEIKGFLGGAIDAPRVEELLNCYAQEGWELVNALTTNQDTGRTRDFVAIFKRIKG